jgi:hypothetical protein
MVITTPCFSLIGGLLLLSARLIVSVSQNAVAQAETALQGCEQCCPGTTIPFWKVLDSFRSYRANQVVYILPVLAHCPSCRAPIDETTFVQPKRPTP